MAPLAKNIVSEVSNHVLFIKSDQNSESLGLENKPDHFWDIESIDVLDNGKHSKSILLRLVILARKIGMKLSYLSEKIILCTWPFWLTWKMFRRSSSQIETNHPWIPAEQKISAHSMLKIYFNQRKAILLSVRYELRCTPVKPVVQSFLISYHSLILIHLLEVFDGSLLDVIVQVTSFLMAEGILFLMRRKRLCIV